MAQLNITLDQEEIMGLLADDMGGAFRKLLQESLNAKLAAESAEQLRAAPYERTGERTDVRNGSRTRPLTTRVGTIELQVPRHRNVPFKTMVFETYKRSEAALAATMAEMVVAGVSTAKVGRVMEEICGRSFSRSTVSEARGGLDEAVGAYLARPIEGRFPFLMLDAAFPKARVNHRIVSGALMIAVGLWADGHKEVLGFGVNDSESNANWLDFAVGLKRRGLSGVRLVTSDAREGIPLAAAEAFPDAPWQRCQAHLTRNVADACPKRLRAGLRQEPAEMFNCATIAQARARRDEMVSDCAALAPKAMECLDLGFDDAMTVMELPEGVRRVVRTTNILERLNREVGRRANVVGVFPSDGSVRRLAGSFLIEENDRWQQKGKLYYSPAVIEAEARVPRLVRITRRQAELRKAA